MFVCAALAFSKTASHIVLITNPFDPSQANIDTRDLRFETLKASDDLDFKGSSFCIENLPVEAQQEKVRQRIAEKKVIESDEPRCQNAKTLSQARREERLDLSDLRPRAESN